MNRLLIIFATLVLCVVSYFAIKADWKKFKQKQKMSLKTAEPSVVKIDFENKKIYVIMFENATNQNIK